MAFQDLPIKRKVLAVTSLSSVIAVLLTAAGLMAYDFFSFRRSIVRSLSTSAAIIAEQSTAAVAFKNEDDAHRVLAALKAEPHVVAAALYDEKNNLYVSYPPGEPASSFPPKPGPAGYRFDKDYVSLFQPVIEGTARQGTLYLKSDLGALRARLRLYLGIALIVLLCSVTVALAVSNALQRRITEPILGLASAAREVSERGNYDVRARKMGGDELGVLTDAFNQMLTRIGKQTLALQQSEEQLRLALEASRTGIWDWNVPGHKMVWDEYMHALFGLKPGPSTVDYDRFLSLIHPEDRNSVAEAAKKALTEQQEFNAEFRVTWPDGSLHYLVFRGKALYDEQYRAVRMTGVSADITERKQAEEIRSFVAAIVESSDDAIIGKDLQSCVVSWNAGAEKMFGYSAEEMIGQPITRLLSLDRPEEEARILDQARSGQIIHYETVRIRKDGKPVDISLSVSPIRNARGEIIGLSSISRDITQRKRAERELMESRARLTGVIGSAMDAIISVDTHQRITIFNAAAERMFNCPVEQALGQPLDRFIPERFREADQHHISSFGETGVTARGMGSLRPLAGVRANGEEFPIEASISQIEVAGQKIYTVILRDITERQHAQEELEKQAAVLREQAQMLDLANVMARALDDRIILWNSGMEKMYGWTRAEALGKNSHELMKTEFPESLDSIRSALFTQGYWEGEVVHARKDSRLLVVTSQWVLHKDAHGHPAAILEVNNDVTERKQAEQEVLRMNAELEQRVHERTAELTAANKELEAFTYSVAHDLRAPLRHIDAFTKILHDDFKAGLPPDAQRYLENIRHGSRNMSHLVDDLLNLARVGRQELKRQPTPLSGLVNEVLADLKHEIEGRTIEWHIQPLPTLECDSGLMKQVFANLLSNAVKYTRPRPVAVIEVGSVKQNGETTVFVRDNGVGFNMKYVDKLFGVFQRLHRAEEFEGTGVGLATVDRIVRKHGGSIWAEASINEGATFYFTVASLDKEPKIA